MKERKHNFPARILAFADAKIMGAMDTYSLWGDSDLYDAEQEEKRSDSCFKAIKTV